MLANEVVADASPSPNKSTLVELNEHSHRSADKLRLFRKKKFIVVKHLDLEQNDEDVNVSLPLLKRQPLYQTKWKSTSSANKTVNEFNVNNSKIDLAKDFSRDTESECSSDKPSTSYCDEEDTFNESLIKNMDHFNKKYREAEGQDTITSLSNNIFLKKFEKMKMSSKTNSNRTLHQDTNNNNILETDHMIKSVTDGENSILTLIPNSSVSVSNTPMLGVRSLFRKRGSTSTKRTLDSSKSSLVAESMRNNLLDFIKSETSLSTINKKSSNVFEMIGKSNSDVNGSLNVKAIAYHGSLRTINVNNEIEEIATSKSDQVFQVLKEAIDKNDDALLDKHFIDQVITTVKFQQLKDKRKKDTVNKLCRILELLVFFTILLMTVFLIINVAHQIKTIKENSSMYAPNSSRTN